LIPILLVKRFSVTEHQKFITGSSEAAIEQNPLSDQSISYFDTQFILILSFHLHVRFPSSAVVGFTVNATCPTHSSFLYLITLIALNKKYKLQRNSPFYFLNSSIAWSLWGSVLLSNRTNWRMVGKFYCRP
jgi:hypothetical protein